jgi:CubicO group peptidase (beta-lactamase class C family)
MHRSLRAGLIPAVLVANVVATGAPGVQAHTTRVPARVSELTSAAQVDAYLAHNQFRGYMLLINRQGQTILSKGYGMADAEHGVPNSIDTPYPPFGVIGFMIALATLKLQEQGKLHVQDKLCAYLSGCPNAWRPITLHELLIGTSGVSSGGVDLFGSPGTIKQTIAVCQTTPLQAAPGTVSEDDPCNRVLLSAVLSRAAGKPFGTLMQELIFRPAGMAHTRVTMSVAPPGSAQVYTSGNPASPLSFGAYPLIYSTIEDIERLDRAVLAGQVISEASVRAIFTPYANDNAPYDGPYRGYGILLLKPKTPAKEYAFVDFGAVGYMISDQFALHSSTMGIWFSNDSTWGDDAENTFVSHLGSLMQPLFPTN